MLENILVRVVLFAGLAASQCIAPDGFDLSKLSSRNDYVTMSADRTSTTLDFHANYETIDRPIKCSKKKNDC
jgi:hypothetical protein